MDFIKDFWNDSTNRMLIAAAVVGLVLAVYSSIQQSKTTPAPDSNSTLESIDN